MVYKRTAQSQKGDPSKQGGPNGSKMFKSGKNQNKLGEAAAKRMQAKLGKIKAQKHDEEVKSDDSDDALDGARQNNATTRTNQILNDPFFQLEDDARAEELGKEVETAD